MLLSTNLEQASFVRLSTIVNDLSGEFQINDFEFYDIFNDFAPWSFGDANRTMVSVGEFTEVLGDVLAALSVSDFDIDTYITSSMQFLRTQGAYIDIAN